MPVDGIGNNRHRSFCVNSGLPLFGEAGKSIFKGLLKEHFLLNLRMMITAAPAVQNDPAGGFARPCGSPTQRRKLGKGFGHQSWRGHEGWRAYKGRPAAKPASTPATKASPPKPSPQPAPEAPKPAEPAKEPTKQERA
jgi:hypothetical protein